MTSLLYRAAVLTLQKVSSWTDNPHLAWAKAGHLLIPNSNINTELPKDWTLSAMQLSYHLTNWNILTEVSNTCSTRLETRFPYDKQYSPPDCGYIGPYKWASINNQSTKSPWKISISRITSSRKSNSSDVQDNDLKIAILKITKKLWEGICKCQNEHHKTWLNEVTKSQEMKTELNT